jgi:hypothetical protein
MDNDRFFESATYSPHSDYEIGEESMFIKVVQSVIGAEETGVWTEANEYAYRNYAEMQNWKILRDILSSGNLVPTFWDLGIIDKDDLLDVEF